MKSESADLSHERVDQQLCDALAAVCGQALPQQFQIISEILRVRVGIGRRGLIARDAKTFEDIIQEAAIDLLRGSRLVCGCDPRHALRILLHSISQGRRDLCLPLRRTESIHELARPGKVMIEYYLPRQMQCIACAGCCDERVAVAVAANPRTELQEVG